MDDNVRQRVNAIMNKKKISINSIANGNKALQRKLNRQINEGSAITSDVIRILSDVLDVSPSWIIYGDISSKTTNGDSFVSGSNGDSNNIGNTTNNYTTNNYSDCQEGKKESLNRNMGKTVKYYPAVNGSMGGVQFLDDPDESFVDIVIPGFSDCEFAINAYGDSMYPVIKSGQIVLLMSWRERFIEWGRIYLVVTKSGYRTIKYLKPSKNEGYVVCESENKENSPSFEIEKEEILKLFLVKGWICKDAI